MRWVGSRLRLGRVMRRAVARRAAGWGFLVCPLGLCVPLVSLAARCHKDETSATTEHARAAEEQMVFRVWALRGLRFRRRSRAWDLGPTTTGALIIAGRAVCVAIFFVIAAGLLCTRSRIA